MDLNDFKTDSNKEADGVRVPLGGEFFVQVRSTALPKYKARMSQLLEECSAVMELGKAGGKAAEAAEEAAQHALYTAASEILVAGWRMNQNGKPVEFTTAICYKAFVDGPKFYELIKSQADSLSLFSAEAETSDLGNLRE